MRALSGSCQDEVAHAGFGNPDHLVGFNQYAMRVIPGAAEHTVVLEQTPVDDLRDPVQGPERWNRAHLEPPEVPANLFLGG